MLKRPRKATVILQDHLQFRHVPAELSKMLHPAKNVSGKELHFRCANDSMTFRADALDVQVQVRISPVTLLDISRGENVIPREPYAELLFALLFRHLADFTAGAGFFDLLLPGFPAPESRFRLGVASWSLSLIRPRGLPLFPALSPARLAMRGTPRPDAEHVFAVLALALAITPGRIPVE